MIFVTVGTELPFDRLLRAVDEWAAETGRKDVFAQIGQAAWRPRFIPYAEFLSPAEFNERFVASSVIVAHAGMGTILSALRYQKPILVMPRRAALQEQRNDHQLATAKQLLALGKINVAMDESELRTQLQRLHELPVRSHTGAYASASLLAAIRDFIAQGEYRASPSLGISTSASGSAGPALGRSS